MLTRSDRRQNEDFPVYWDNPDDEKKFWTRDPTLLSGQVTPLDFSGNIVIIYEAQSKGIEEAFDLKSSGELRHVNTYVYSAMPNIKIGDYASEKLNNAIKELDKQWEAEWLPEIISFIDSWKSFDLQGASDKTCLNHLIETEKYVRRAWEIHTLLNFPAVLAVYLFEEMYYELFTEAGIFEAHELLAGFENKIIESNQAMWHLSREAMSMPAVSEIIMEKRSSEIMKFMTASDECRTFVENLNHFLKEYGKQSGKKYLSYPFWIEDPTPVFKNLKNYIDTGSKDPNDEFAKTVGKRKQCLAEARRNLEEYPLAVKDEFESLLRAAQAAGRLREEHNFWIDSQVMYFQRRVFLEFGNRFKAKGMIEKQDDIFYLTFNEIKQSADSLPKITVLRPLVRERRETEKRFAGVNPPPALGKPPSTPLSLPDEPIVKAFARLLGDAALEPVDENQNREQSDIPDELKGNPASPGKVQGKAKIINSFSEAHKLKPGNIMVTSYTLPSWTPLFSTISAVVTNEGGILSHCAVVAREYGIPAVAGTLKATSVINDNQIIEVDGDAGIVRIIR